MKKGNFLLLTSSILLVLLSQIGCATHNRTIAGGMLIGATVGAGVGHQFVHHGANRQYETENTIITSAVFALAVGGALAWHYRELEKSKVAISGRYSRYRLCDPNEDYMDFATQFGQGNNERLNVFALKEEQIGDLAISLDDHTKWVYPDFRKRYLPPDRKEMQVMSERYVWEIIRPGRFVTRSQNPRYFLSQELQDEQ